MLLTPKRLAALLSLILACAQGHTTPRPNVILIMTDDQGYGDFGIMGNEIINTPHLDQLARESASMSEFYVNPVCSPTRANLMTGRYNYRTRAIDTYKGRSLMDPEEYTIAEALGDAGYATGIFGKWHLGDNYPLRASDQGFQESYVILGGGLGQPSEPIENQRRYTNPILYQNNQKIETRGYCTDLYFEAAAKFIDQSLAREKPFFAYIAPNAPHKPLHDVPEALYQKYKRMDLRSVMLDDRTPEDDIARMFAMIENIDENVGRLMDQLQRRDIARDTLVIYLNDNGPDSVRYVGPFRGRKNEVHEGGVRSPLWVRWPDRLKPGTTSDRVSAHYDIMPTILEATGTNVPQEVQLDGRSLLPLLENRDMSWTDRDIFIQSHRGNAPVPEHSMLMRNQKWKLVRASGFHNETPDPKVPFELYDMENDPGETRNLADSHQEILQQMLNRYHHWFEDVSSTRTDNYAPPRMRIGDTNNRQLLLTGQDRRETASGYEWALQIDRKGVYNLEIQWAAPQTKSDVRIELGEQTLDIQLMEKTDTFTLRKIQLKEGPVDLRMSAPQGIKKKALPYYLILTKA